MKILASFLFLVAALGSGCLGTFASRRPVVPEPGTPLAAFNQNLRTAEWLAGYRRAVDAATLAQRQTAPDAYRPGGETLAVRTADGWLVVFGALDEAGEAYAPSAAFTVDPAGWTAAPAALDDASPFAPLARAWRAAYRQLAAPSLAGDGTVLDLAARVDDHGNVEVWLCPAWQPNGYLVFGRSERLLYSRDGRRLVEHDLWDYGRKRFRPSGGDNLAIGSLDCVAPPVGDLLFILRFHRQFNRLLVDHAHYRSYVERRDQAYQWVHLPRADRARSLLGEPVPEVAAPDLPTMATGALDAARNP